VRRLLPFAFTFAVSAGLHLALLAPVLLLLWLDREIEDSPGDDGTEDAPAGNDGGEVAHGVEEPPPITVSLYDEAAANAAAAAEIVPASGPAAAPTATAAPRGAVDGDATVSDPVVDHMGAAGRRPRGNRKPCEAIEEIVAKGENRWRVERDVVDFYATHLKELEKQVGVSTHRGSDGKPDGARIYLPRCSVLRQAGMRHGDIVHTINDRRVATIPDAVAAYLLLRDDPDLTVEVTRKNGDDLVFHYKLVK
jgi:hypothetical protein